MSNDIVNSLPADLSVITADGTDKANYDGAMVYATDLEGKLTKINLMEKFTIDTDPNSPTYKTIKEDVPATTLFIAESTSENGRYIYTRPEVTINNDNNLWLYFGTGNTQKLHEQSNKIKNRAYGIKDKDFPNYVNISTPGDIRRCKTAPACPGTTDLGWYANLPRAQKLTAEPTVDKNRVYFPIYEPTTSTNACNTGKAILTAYDTKCGNSVLNVHLGTGVLSKVVVQGDNLYIGIAGEAKKNIAGFTSTGNLITGKSKAKSSGGKVQLEGWKEN
jgi:type IV pilus assembly protein PilY1